ncbi:MAG: hypothetical protein Q9208_005210 [Pyrenodesmia sp. 3 TL-2023]
MDFPQSLLTNVHSAGALVTYYGAGSGLWLFNVAESSNEPPANQLTNNSKLVENIGLKLVQTGIVSSQQLKRGATEPHGRTHLEKDISHQPVLPHTHSPMFAEDGDLTIPIIYQAFTLSDVVNLQDDFGENLVGHDDLIVLVPFGSRYTFAGLENDGSDPYIAARHEKDLARAMLKSCGIQLSTQTAWIRLESCTGKLLDKSALDGSLVDHIWWPAHLCFVLHSPKSAGSTDVLNAVANGNFVDPLSEAEQWFLGRGAREAAISAKQKAQEGLRLREKHISEGSAEGQKEDETAVSHANRTEQYLSTQEASGIYPTPPDGLAFNTQGPYTNQDSIDAPSVEAHLSAADAHDILHGSGNASPVTNIAGNHLRKEENQDLFGDMDTDMFDANGLTEADLDFFDEPNTKEDQPEFDYEPATASPMETIPSPEQETLNPGAPPCHMSPSTSQEKTDGGDLQSPEDNEVLTEIIQNQALNETLNENSTTTSISGAASPVGNQEGMAQSTTQTELDQGLEATQKEAPLDMISPQTGGDGVDEKYRGDGRYATALPKTVDGSRPGLALRTTERELPSIGPLLARSDDSSDGTDDGPSDEQSLDEWEDEDRSMSSFDPAGPDVGGRIDGRASKKRKREPNAKAINLATPAESAESPESPVNLSTSPHIGSMQYLLGYSPCKDLVTCEDLPTDVSSILVGNSQKFIQIAQLVADQMVLRNGTMDISPNIARTTDDLIPSASTEDSSEMMREVLLTAFPTTEHHDLKSFTTLDLDTSAFLSSKLKSATQAVGERTRLTHSQSAKWQGDIIFTVQPPFLSVWRGEDATELAPPALYFWEELGLAPCQQRKDILAFCIYPEHGTIQNAASAFLEAMENSYQSCRFGRHQAGSGTQDYQKGLVPVSISSAQPGDVFESLERVYEDFGAQISDGDPDGFQYVVYMVNPFNNDSMLPYLCAAFYRLCSIYACALKLTGKANAKDLVLQVIPLSFLVNCDCLTIPPPKSYIKLAFEVYSRCSPIDGNEDAVSSPFASGSAIRLARPIPKAVNFRLTPQSPEGILANDSSLHLAYSWDVDYQWLACAWSDNLGIKQWSAVYCLQEPQPDFWTAFSATVNEILDTTKEMLQPDSQSWELYIVKDGNLQQRELEAWRFHSASFLQQQVTITILSIELNPPICFPPNKPAVNFPTSAANVDTSPAATTPHEQVLTPDHSSPTATQTPNRQMYNSPAANAASGFADHDLYARLIDVVSETWCMLSPMPIPDPYLPTPHLAFVCMSGYLLKRAGAEDEDGLLPLGVNLISLDLSKNEPGTKQEQEQVLREVLTMYADLACLARLRGTEEWRRGLLPWHVAAARKARRAVIGCMRWGKPEEE